MQSHLDGLAVADLLRNPCTIDSACGPRVVVDGREVVCLCSNDYLGLAADPAVKAAAIEAIARFGIGAVHPAWSAAPAACTSNWSAASPSSRVRRPPSLRPPGGRLTTSPSRPWPARAT